jgi:uncharacterized integral membrane protein (TIGR00697 family)
MLCNIQVLKLVELFGFTVTLGNIAYGSVFLATDLLVECYGKQEARKAVNLGFIALVFTTISLQFTVNYIPSQADVNHPAMLQLFNHIPRITIASLMAYLLAQYHDVWAFNWWKELTKGKHLWLRNYAATTVSQLIDSAAFTLLAFYGDYELRVVWSIFYTTVIIKWIVAVVDTPAIYIGRWLLQSKIAEEKLNILCYSNN